MLLLASASKVDDLLILLGTAANGLAALNALGLFLH